MNEAVVNEALAPELSYCHKCAPLRLGLFDLGGVLYHAHYFALLEEAREAVLQANNLPCHELAKNREFLAIAESHQQFIKPILYGDEIKVYLWLSSLRKTSLEMNYLLTAEKNGLETAHHRASTRLVFVTDKSGQLAVAQLPESLRTAFNKYLDK